MNMASLQAIRGMNDILPHETPLWRWVEKQWQTIADAYHYREIRLPLLEKTALFQRSIGEITDIVEKEMYTFLDRSHESVTLRPEGTAGCVRAAITNGLLYHQQQRLWYAGPMFRYERPQKGRYRQFYQIGVETFGFSDYFIEVELLLMTSRFFQKLGLSQKINLQINSLGSSDSRAEYRAKLVEYCQKHEAKLDEDCRRRLTLNPLRILDSKNPDIQLLLTHAPKLIDFLDENSRQSFQQLCNRLDCLKLPYEINPHLVRGLDYYTGTVFEWTTALLGAQGTVCAGGRYDGLAEILGGQPTPAAGFAFGMERIVELCADTAVMSEIDIFFIATAGHEIAAIQQAERLRDIFPDLRIETNYTGGNLKSQFKRADKSGARIALILGEDEISKNMITCKHLRQQIPQTSFTFDALVNYLRSIL